MSTRTVFASNSVEYLLPAAGDAGGVMAMGAEGGPVFGQVFTTTCNLDISNPLINGITLTMQQSGKKVDVFISGPTMQAVIPAGNPLWGSLVSLAEPIPASLIPATSCALGNVAFQLSGGGSAALNVQVNIAGQNIVQAPGQISFVYPAGFAQGTYFVGSRASDQWTVNCVYLGSYLIE